MSGYRLIVLAIITATTLGCSYTPDNLEPITSLEAERYSGKCYEIARLNHSFERNLSNVSVTHARGDASGILVLNKGLDAMTGEWKQVEGRAKVMNDEMVGSPNVPFFGPFYGGYHIIALYRQDYRFLLVIGTSRSHLWVLSRSKSLDVSIYGNLLEKAGDWGFDTTKLMNVQHNLTESGGLNLSQQANIKNKIENQYITPCPQTPNCVSSIDTNRGHFIEPLKFSGSTIDAQYRLLQILNKSKGARVVTFEDNLIEAEFISSIFRFVDDVKFYLDDRKKIIHVKSSSRVGFSDLGVNRRRIEKIRQQLKQAEDMSQL